MYNAKTNESFIIKKNNTNNANTIVDRNANFSIVSNIMNKYSTFSEIKYEVYQNKLYIEL